MLSRVRIFLRPVKLWARRARGVEPVGRRAVARHYLSGHGIEIGALNRPLEVPRRASVRYVDRMSVPMLLEHYPELRHVSLVNVDVVDDGERLGSFPDGGEDFVIANHFLEHCQDPIGTIGNMMRVLRPGGVLFLAVPDKRSTFDCERDITPVAHMVNDYQNGADASRLGHFDDVVRHSVGLSGREAEAEVKRFLDTDYSIHFHVWDAKAYVRLLLEASLHVDFDIEFMMSSENEVISVLRKPGGSPDRVREELAAGSLAAARRIWADARLATNGKNV